MTQDITTTGPSRRSIAKGAAWAVPAVSVAAAAPSLAASPLDCTDPVNWQNNISIDSGCLISAVGANVFSGWRLTNTATAPGGCAIPTTATFTERISLPSTRAQEVLRGPALLLYKTELRVLGLPTHLIDSFTGPAWPVGYTVDSGPPRTLEVRRTIKLRTALAPGESVEYGYLVNANLLDALSHSLIVDVTGQTSSLTGAIIGTCG